MPGISGRDPLYLDSSARILEPDDRVHEDPHFGIQKIPGVFRWYRHLLPIMPLAARGWRLATWTS